MNFDLYQHQATRTFKPKKELSAEAAEILDWAVGLSGEVGEVSELIKHNIFHEEPIDKMKLAKELGDVIWYISALCQSYNIPMEACAMLNIAKLTHRHGGAFSFDKSVNRHAREAKFEDTAEYKDLKKIIESGILEHQLVPSHNVYADSLPVESSNTKDLGGCNLSAKHLSNAVIKDLCIDGTCQISGIIDASIIEGADKLRR